MCIWRSYNFVWIVEGVVLYFQDSVLMIVGSFSLSQNYPLSSNRTPILFFLSLVYVACVYLDLVEKKKTTTSSEFED